MRIDVEGVSLAFDDRGGGGVPVVCLHAIGHDGSDFGQLAERLRGQRVIAIDWPGQGGSAPDRVPPSTRRYLELLTGFIDGLGLERVILVGNSIGGGAAPRSCSPTRAGSTVAAGSSASPPG